MTSSSHIAAAPWRAVLPAGVLAVTSAPSATSSDTASTTRWSGGRRASFSPRPEATMSGVVPNAFGSAGSAPASSSIRIISRSAARAASQNGEAPLYGARET